MVKFGAIALIVLCAWTVFVVKSTQAVVEPVGCEIQTDIVCGVTGP